MANVDGSVNAGIVLGVYVALSVVVCWGGRREKGGRGEVAEATQERCARREMCEAELVWNVWTVAAQQHNSSELVRVSMDKGKIRKHPTQCHEVAER